MNFKPHPLRSQALLGNALPRSSASLLATSTMNLPCSFDKLEAELRGSGVLKPGAWERVDNVGRLS